MGARYVNPEDVKARLSGKVTFTDDTDSENAVGTRLLTQWIEEAEAQVEMDLSPRYEYPFQTSDSLSITKLPKSTFFVIRQLCLMMSCIVILENDFGKGTSVNGRKYAESLREKYEDLVNERLLKFRKDKEDTRQWAYPPLTGLKLAYFNTEADDGYFGQVLNSTTTPNRDQNVSPSWLVNDPFESWFNGVIDE